MYQIKLRNNLELLATSASFLLLAFWGVENIVGQPDTRIRANKIVAGRVFASVNLFTYGSGLGPKYQSFIFQPEASVDSTQHWPELVRIEYQFYNAKDRLGKDFFDHAKKYELDVLRDRTCDDKPLNFGYVGIKDETTRVRIMAVLNGAKEELLKEDAILPCYVLGPSGLKLQNPKKT